MTNYLISYDIQSDKLRTSLSKVLARKGCFRIQYSVFIAPNYTFKELKQLKYKLKTLLNTKEKTSNDSLVIAPLTKAQTKELWLEKPSPFPIPEKKFTNWT